jgi:hypothetical protein
MGGLVMAEPSDRARMSGRRPYPYHPEPNDIHDLGLTSSNGNAGMPCTHRMVRASPFDAWFWHRTKGNETEQLQAFSFLSRNLRVLAILLGMSAQ